MSGEPVFGDTSGFLALLDTDDVFHSVALAEWKSMAAIGCFERAFEKWRLVQSRKLSLVDITSFDCMRQKGITQAFTFDSQFAQQGFITCLSEEG